MPFQEAGAQGNEVTTSSGLQYVELTIGTGATAESGQTVTVHYTGWLENGKKFDSSIDRGQPFSFPLGAGRVIKGWDEGVKGMKVGGKRKLIIPSKLGYGTQGAGGVIPPNATLTFPSSNDIVQVALNWLISPDGRCLSSIAVSWMNTIPSVLISASSM
jgi:FKBP-type peptidyl-prolyl cis-trans isomerase